jgi:hypothetical protein
MFLEVFHFRFCWEFRLFRYFFVIPEQSFRPLGGVVNPIDGASYLGVLSKNKNTISFLIIYFIFQIEAWRNWMKLESNKGRKPVR